MKSKDNDSNSNSEKEKETREEDVEEQQQQQQHQETEENEAQEEHHPDDLDNNQGNTTTSVEDNALNSSREEQSMEKKEQSMNQGKEETTETEIMEETSLPNQPPVNFVPPKEKKDNNNSQGTAGATSDATATVASAAAATATVASAAIPTQKPPPSPPPTNSSLAAPSDAAPISQSETKTETANLPSASSTNVAATPPPASAAANPPAASTSSSAPTAVETPMVIMAEATVLSVQPATTVQEQNNSNQQQQQDLEIFKSSARALPVLQVEPIYDDDEEQQLQQQQQGTLVEAIATAEQQQPPVDNAHDHEMTTNVRNSNNSNYDPSVPPRSYSSNNTTAAATTSSSSLPPPEQPQQTTTTATPNDRTASNNNEQAPPPQVAPLEIHYDESTEFQNNQQRSNNSNHKRTDRIVLSCTKKQCLLGVICGVIALLVFIIVGNLIEDATQKNDFNMDLLLLRQRVHFAVQWGMGVGGCQQDILLQAPIRLKCLHSERLVLLASHGAECTTTPGADDGATKLECLAQDLTQHNLTTDYYEDFRYQNVLNQPPYDAILAWVIVACDSSMEAAAAAGTASQQGRTPPHAPDLDYRMEMGEATCTHNWYKAEEQDNNSTKRVIGGAQGVFVAKGFFCEGNNGNGNNGNGIGRKHNAVDFSFGPCGEGEFFSYYGETNLPANFGGPADDPLRTSFCGARSECSVFRDNCIGNPNPCDEEFCRPFDLEVRPFSISKDECVVAVTERGGYFENSWSVDALTNILEPRLVQPGDYLTAINFHIAEQFDFGSP